MLKILRIIIVCLYSPIDIILSFSLLAWNKKKIVTGLYDMAAGNLPV